MAKIETVGRDRYRAQFNQRMLTISSDKDGIRAVGSATGEVITGAELTSVKNLLTWHVKSKRGTSEVPALWTVRK